MNERILAKRYTQALIGNPPSNDVVQNLEDAHKCLVAIISTPKLGPYIKSPIHTKSEKTSVIHSIVSSITDKKTVQQFFAVLVDKQRLGLASFIKEEIEVQLSKYKETLSVNVYVSTDVSEQEKSSIKKQLQQHINQTLELHFYVDASIIGGYKAVAGHTIYDGSVKTMLNNFKDMLIKA